MFNLSKTWHNLCYHGTQGNAQDARLKKPRFRHGFGLIELMMVVAIVAVLAAVAVPQYAAFIQKARNAQGKILMSSLEKQQLAYMAFYDRFGTLEELGGWGNITVSALGGGGGGGPLGGGGSQFAKGPGGIPGGDVIGTPSPPPPSGTPSGTPAPPEPTPDVGEGANVVHDCDKVVRAQNVATTALAFVSGAGGASFSKYDVQSSKVPGSNFCVVQWFLSADKRDVAAFTVEPMQPNSSFYQPETVYHYMSLLTKFQNEHEIVTFKGSWIVWPGLFGAL
jgi:prepilin-type N-terminal cleavage/methylation domain-containing protein